MAFISEIKYGGTGEANSNEFVEVTLVPGEVAADFTLSLYDHNGYLHTGASSFFTPGEFTLQDIINATGGPPGTVTSTVGGLDLEVLIHPDDPNALVFIIPCDLGKGTTAKSAEAVALTNTTAGVVIDAYDIGTGSNSANFKAGAAIGANPGSTINANSANSVHIDINGAMTAAVPDPGYSVICFCDGSLILTMGGAKPVESLKPGDILRTENGQYLPLRHAFCRTVSLENMQANPKLRPVRISKGALGQGLPERDLFVSRQHRIMVRSKIVERMFGVESALVAAHVLTDLPGIDIVCPDQDMTYWHLLLERHAVILAEGAPAESLFIGAQTLELVPAPVRNHVVKQFPAFAAPQDLSQAARYVPSLKRQRRLIARHQSNEVDVLSQAPTEPKRGLTWAG